ncbi:MAG: hypothetical protein ACR2IF_15165 [Terriglobales bacterium]
MTPKKRKSSSASFEGAGRRLDHAMGEAARRLESETNKLIAYLNDEVVPSVREHSSRGLRKAATELDKFAKYLDTQRRKR